MKERLAAMNDSEGCVSDVAVRQTWCRGSCGESKDTPVLSMNADGTYSANSCKCCSGIPGTPSTAFVFADSLNSLQPLCDGDLRTFCILIAYSE